mgnify:CR=1 FL=1
MRVYIVKKSRRNPENHNQYFTEEEKIFTDLDKAKSYMNSIKPTGIDIEEYETTDSIQYNLNVKSYSYCYDYNRYYCISIKVDNLV